MPSISTYLMQGFQTCAIEEIEIPLEWLFESIARFQFTRLHMFEILASSRYTRHFSWYSLNLYCQKCKNLFHLPISYAKLLQK